MAHMGLCALRPPAEALAEQEARATALVEPIAKSLEEQRQACHTLELRLQDSPRQPPWAIRGHTGPIPERGQFPNVYHQKKYVSVVYRKLCYCWRVRVQNLE